DNYNNTASHPETGNNTVIILPVASYISGRVINSTNETEGIASANVTVFNETFSNSSLTNATGYFNITVPPGDYTIKAKKQHYWRDERPVKVEHAKPAENVTLALYYDATAPVIDLNTANPPNGSIITDSTPVISINYTDSPKGEEGIDVESVILKINNRAVAPTITNKSVTYNPPLSGLDDGEYTVYVELRDRAGNPCNASWSFTIVTKGTVKGFVKDSYGNAIRGATVELLSETATVESTATDQDGSYEFLNIRKGRYWVRVTADELRFKAKTVLVEPLGIAWANFTAEAVRSYIFGYVIDENNNPVVGAKVTASSPYYTAHAYTNLSGYYKILGLPVGIYNLTAERSGYQTGQRTISLTQEEPLEQVFVLAKSPELVAPAQKKPAFIPDVSIAAAILALILIAGVNTLRHRFRRKISI
ncbi:MAG: carboxypeptidase regulatory-like domain-containing protein, partial [Candidatus Thermoplasmatota archaeon]|nr:carboxypeptidase regulatory-like domain-containing protein [Candidatus Thermoplasmatota archaeon]